MLYVMFVDCMINVEINCSCSLMVIVMPHNVMDATNVIIEIYDECHVLWWGWLCACSMTIVML